jgi:hypothetical protein
MADTLGNGISRKSRISLDLVIVVIVIVAGGTWGWSDLKQDVNNSYRMLTDLCDQVTVIEGSTSDRWHKLDDLQYMTEFARHNSLKTVPHFIAD